MMKKAAILLTAILCLCSCRHDVGTLLGKTRQKSEPVRVRVMECSHSEQSATFCYVGSIEAAHQSTINSPYSATLERLNVKKGQKIREGEVVAVLGSAAVESAYEMARSTLDRAEDGYRRAKALEESGSVSEVKMVEIESQLRQAQASEKAAKDALDGLTIRAPYSGTVGEVYAVKGENFAPAQRIATIINTEAVEIRIPVPENEYPTLSVGDKAKVIVPAIGVETSAKLVVKGVAATRLAHTYECVLSSIADAGGMVPGMVCKVYFTEAKGPGIVIPTSAVMTDSEGRYVWTVRDGAAIKKHIRVSGYSGKGVLIEEGLEESDIVITEGSRKVSTGMKVETWQ